MAHTITTQVILNGRKLTVVKFNIKGDGVSGELTNAVLFDASAYLTQSTENKIMEVKYNLIDFSAELIWDATANVPAISLGRNHPGYDEYWTTGGIVNNAGTGRTGDILITTTGLAATARAGYIHLFIFQRGYLPPLL